MLKSKITGVLLMLMTSLIFGLLFWWWSGFIGVGVCMFITGIIYWFVDWPFHPYPWEDDYGN